VNIFSLLLVYYFIKEFNKNDIETYNVLFIFSIFIVYIKITTLPLLLLPFSFLGIHFKKMITKTTLSFVLGILVFLLFIIKNTILTGYPMFPSLLFKSYSTVDYAIPLAFYHFSFDRMRCYSFFISSKEYAQSNAYQIFFKWLMNVYSIIIVILLVLIPDFIKRFFNQKNYWILSWIRFLRIKTIFDFRGS
jgi:hypothetical protein